MAPHEMAPHEIAFMEPGFESSVERFRGDPAKQGCELWLLQMKKSA